MSACPSAFQGIGENLFEQWHHPPHLARFFLGHHFQTITVNRSSDEEAGPACWAAIPGVGGYANRTAK